MQAMTINKYTKVMFKKFLASFLFDEFNEYNQKLGILNTIESEVHNMRNKIVEYEERKSKGLTP